MPFPGPLERCCTVRVAKLYATRLRSGEGFLGALGDHLALSLGDDGHDVDRQLVRFRHVGSYEVDASLLQTGEEVNVTGQSIELGDDQRRRGAPRMGDRLRKLRTIGPLAPTEAECMRRSPSWGNELGVDSCIVESGGAQS